MWKCIFLLLHVINLFLFCLTCSIGQISHAAAAHPDSIFPLPSPAYFCSYNWGRNEKSETHTHTTQKGGHQREEDWLAASLLKEGMCCFTLQVSQSRRVSEAPAERRMNWGFGGTGTLKSDADDKMPHPQKHNYQLFNCLYDRNIYIVHPHIIFCQLYHQVYPNWTFRTIKVFFCRLLKFSP